MNRAMNYNGLVTFYLIEYEFCRNTILAWQISNPLKPFAKCRGIHLRVMSMEWNCSNRGV